MKINKLEQANYQSKQWLSFCETKIEVRLIQYEFLTIQSQYDHFLFEYEIEYISKNFKKLKRKISLQFFKIILLLNLLYLFH